MNPLQKIIAAMKKLHGSLITEANTKLAGMKPIEQHQLAAPVMGALSGFEWHIERMAGFDDMFAEIETAAEAMVETKSEAKIAAQIESGDLVRKDDHEAKMTAAREDEKTKTQESLQAELDTVKTASAKRTSIMGEHGAIAAASFTDEELASDDVETHLATLVTRKEKLAEHKVTEEVAATAYKQALSVGYGEGSDAAFQEKVDMICDFEKPAEGVKPKGEASAAASKGGTPPVVVPKTPATPPAAGGDEKLVPCF